LDVEARGKISEWIDGVFERQNVLKTVNWILEADDLVRSKEDLALGYFMGSLVNVAYDIAFHKRVKEKTDMWLKKRLEKIYGKEGAAKELREQARVVEEERAKGGRRMSAELTEEEDEDIRNMLIPMIQRFREKIRKELAMKSI